MEKEIKKLIASKKQVVRKIVNGSKEHPDVIIARYTAAFAVNFTDWIGKTIPFVRGRRSLDSLVKNLRCEIKEDHIKMLLDFAEQTGSLPEKRDYEHVLLAVQSARNLFINTKNAGLSGLALCTMLENLSLVFIPDLERRARLLGCKNHTYIKKHGVADKEHSQSLLTALIHESQLDYPDALLQIKTAAAVAVGIIKKIYVPDDSESEIEC